MRATVVVGALGLTAVAAHATEPVDLAVVARIRTEAFQRSQLMETLQPLVDRFGPRLGGSPEYAEAARWAQQRLAGWGLADARLERFAHDGTGWSLESFSVEMTAPRYLRIVAHPHAWSPGIDGVLAGEPKHVVVRTLDDLEPLRGSLRGAIVMNGAPGIEPPDLELPSGRFSDDELQRRARQTDPGARGFGPFVPVSPRESRAASARRRARRDALLDALVAEGVAALILPDRAGGLAVSADGTYGRRAREPLPIFSMAAEHYGRIARLLAADVPVQLELRLRVRHHPEAFGANVLAEIPGSDPALRDEVVMLGAHLDSVLTGAGATDDAAGCAVMMEAMRILQAIGARPRRTVRVALWGSEELGLLGSVAHVKARFGDPDTGERLPGHARLSGYFNLDNGSGRIRGVYLQGNEAVRPVFAAYLDPFRDVGATTLSILNAGGTDHEPFDALGLPGFQFIQDALDYETRVVHSTLDVYEAVVPDDLRQAAAVVASFAYHTAMRDERLPRKPPAPEDDASGS